MSPAATSKAWLAPVTGSSWVSLQEWSFFSVNLHSNPSWSLWMYQPPSCKVIFCSALNMGFLDSSKETSRILSGQMASPTKKTLRKKRPQTICLMKQGTGLLSLTPGNAGALESGWSLSAFTVPLSTINKFLHCSKVCSLLSGPCLPLPKTVRQDLTHFQRSWLSRTHQGQRFPAKHFPPWLPSSRLLAKASFASFCQCLVWREVCHTHQSPCKQVKPNLLWTKPVEWKAAIWFARIGCAPHLEQLLSQGHFGCIAFGKGN